MEHAVVTSVTHGMGTSTAACLDASSTDDIGSSVAVMGACISTKSLRCILFDADGTLIDSLRAHVDFCHAMNAKHAAALSLPPRGLVHDRTLAAAPMDQFFLKCGFTPAMVPALVSEYETDFAESFPIYMYEGVDAMLTGLACKVTLAVVTSNTADNVRRALQRGERSKEALRPPLDKLAPAAATKRADDPLAFIMGVETGERSKAVAIGTALSQLGVHSSEALYVGDTAKDYLAASQCGVPFVGVSYGFEDLPHTLTARLGIDRSNAEDPECMFKYGVLGVVPEVATLHTLLHAVVAGSSGTPSGVPLGVVEGAQRCKWNGFYARGFSPWDSLKPASQLVELVQRAGGPLAELCARADAGGRPMRCLELGCGTGASCVYLATALDCVSSEVVGVDLAERPLLTARAAAAADGVSTTCQFVQADAFELPATLGFTAANDGDGCSVDTEEPRFDFMFDCQCFHVLREVHEGRILSVMARLLRPGGLLLVLTGNDAEPACGPCVLSRQQLCDAFGGDPNSKGKVVQREHSNWKIEELRTGRFDSTAAYAKLSSTPLMWCALVRRL